MAATETHRGSFLARMWPRKRSTTFLERDLPTTADVPSPKALTASQSTSALRRSLSLVAPHKTQPDVVFVTVVALTATARRPATRARPVLYWPLQLYMVWTS